MKYKRVVITRHGGPEVLQVVEDELPEPQIGQVRVKILAAGVANTDTMLRESNMPGLGAPSPPYSPGKELVGVVDKLGDGVSTVEVGQTVASCLTGFGAYSEFICAPETELTPAPPGLDPAEAVCLVANYAVAYQVLHRAAQVAPGERVLIHGAAGGIGTALLQLGRLAELEMYGTASTGKQELVANLGATPIDYKKEDFVERVFRLTGDGVDVVSDPIGGSYVRRSYKTLRPGGRLVVFGAVSFAKDGMLKILWNNMVLNKILNFIPDKRATMNYMMKGGAKNHSRPEWYPEDLSKLFDLLAQEKIRPIVTRMPLVEAARAHELIGKASVKGKIVLTCNTSS
jgi:NADPH:quinone reductase-like Zn-dependent oxidoreductase